MRDTLLQLLLSEKEADIILRKRQLGALECKSLPSHEEQPLRDALLSSGCFGDSQAGLLVTGCIWRSREVLFDVITQLVPEEGRVSVLALVATLWGEWAGWIKRVPDNSVLVNRVLDLDCELWSEEELYDDVDDELTLIGPGTGIPVSDWSSSQKTLNFRELANHEEQLV